MTVHTCRHTSALPESVQTACTTGAFKSHHNNQAECLSKLDYILNLTRYLYGQLIITLTVKTLLIQKVSVRVFMGVSGPEQPPEGPLPSPMVLEPASVLLGVSVLPP